MGIRLILQVLMLFVFTVMISVLYAMMQVYVIGIIFSMGEFFELGVSIFFVVLNLYVNFFYCFPGQVAELYGREVGVEHYPRWVRMFIAFSGALFVEEVFYFLFNWNLGFSNVSSRCLSVLVFFLFYGYVMSWKKFRNGS